MMSLRAGKGLMVLKLAFSEVIHSLHASALCSRLWSAFTCLCFVFQTVVCLHMLLLCVPDCGLPSHASALCSRLWSAPTKWEGWRRCLFCRTTAPTSRSLAPKSASTENSCSEYYSLKNCTAACRSISVEY